MDDKDCPDCIYGPVYNDDGIPTRHVTKACKPCADHAQRALDHLVVHKLAQMPPVGSA